MKIILIKIYNLITHPARRVFSLHMPTGKFRAYITVNRKQINLGLYEHFEDAVAARVVTELEIYGYTRP